MELLKKGLAALAIAGCLQVTKPVMADSAMVQNDIVIGNNDDTNDSDIYTDYPFYVYRSGVWSVPASGLVTDNYQQGSEFGPGYMQSAEFDNFNGVSHNPAGNLLMCNFGNSYTGFEIYNVATNGNNHWATLWSMKAESNGTYKGSSDGVSCRGGGLSINPGNTKVAWATSDTINYTDPNTGISVSGGTIMVLDYNAGAHPGTGQSGMFTSGEAMIGGPRLAGNQDIGAPLGTNVTQGTTWLDDNNVLAINSYGELIHWNVANVPAGTDHVDSSGNRTTEAPLSGSTPMIPTVDNNWSIVCQLNLTNLQFISVLYNKEIDPDHIYVAYTTKSYVGYICQLTYDGNAESPTISLSSTMTLPASKGEPRENAFDSNGNLLWSSYCNDVTSYTLIGMLEDAATNFGDISKVSVFATGSYSGYNGMDCACGVTIKKEKIPGDANGDKKVDVGDLGILAANYGGMDKSWAEGDFNNDGKVDVGDLGILAANYGTNASGCNYDSDYAKVFGTAEDEDTESSTLCSSLGLSLIATLAMMGLMFARKLEQ
jgi:hypothetical protein